MSTIPITQMTPTIPPPQTCSGTLIQHGIDTPVTDFTAPGERPSFEGFCSRDIYYSSFEFKVTSTPTDILWEQPVLQWSDISEYEPAGTQSGQFLGAMNPLYIPLCLSRYWNCSVKFTFWALKAPMATGRLRIALKPYLRDRTFNMTLQREICEEWDLSESNIFSFRVDGYLMREWRDTRRGQIVKTDLSNKQGWTPALDYRFGHLSVNVANIYQPGSIYPDVCPIKVFVSLENPTFRTLIGPPLAVEDSALGLDIEPDSLHKSNSYERR